MTNGYLDAIEKDTLEVVDGLAKLNKEGVKVSNKDFNKIEKAAGVKTTKTKVNQPKKLPQQQKKPQQKRPQTPKKGRIVEDDE
jgi:hypothetical protein